MLSKTLRELADELCFESAEPCVWGSFEGFAVSLGEAGSVIGLRVCASFPDEASRSAFYAATREANLRAEYKMRDFSVGEHDLVFHLTGGAQAKERCRGLLERVCQILQQSGALNTQYCARCGEPVGDEPSKTLLLGGAAARLHLRCANELLFENTRLEAERETEPKRYVFGTLGALLGGVLGAIPWGIAYYFGYFAAPLGLLVGFLAKKGYELMHARAGWVKLIVILLVTLLCVPLAQFGADAISLAVSVSRGEMQFGYSDIPAVIVFALGESAEYRSATVTNLCLGLLFAMLGAWRIVSDVRNDMRAERTAVIDPDVRLR